MPGEVIEHPIPGWNELPHERGSYAWWNGQRFTTIAFRTNDHWEYVTEEPVPGTAPPPSRHRLRTLLIVSGGTIGVVFALMIVAFLVLVTVSTNTLQNQVRDVHHKIEASGLHCSGLSIIGPEIGASPSYAQGTCHLDEAHGHAEVDIRADSPTSVDYQVQGLAQYVIGSGWYLTVSRQGDDETPLLRDIARRLNARCVC